MTVYDAIMTRRTIRKFKQREIEREKLIKLVDCGRMAAFGANVQPLRFAVITDKELLGGIFPLTKWAGYLTGGEPSENERPAAYIAVLGDMSLRRNGEFETDAGAAVTNMMLAACEEGLASCWLGAIDRGGLKKLLALPDGLHVVFLLALGYPAQESRAVDMKDGDVKYYIDENGCMCVPKRALGDILIEM